MDEQARVRDLKSRFNARMNRSGARCCCTVHGKPDSLGRQSFTLEWVGRDALREGKVRGQCFFARVADHVTLEEGQSC